MCERFFAVLVSGWLTTRKRADYFRTVGNPSPHQVMEGLPVVEISICFQDQICSNLFTNDKAAGTSYSALMQREFLMRLCK
jgi:hypothetical protein